MLGLDPTVMGYPEEKTREFQKRLLESARQMPGVRSAALARAIPFDQNPYFIDFVPEGFQLARDEQSVFTFGNVVSADYFETLNLVMARGRGIRSTDTATAPKVAVINEELARRYFPNQDPVGRRLRVVQSGEWHEIVGVARQSKYLFPTEAPFPYLYLASSQVYSPRMTLLVSAQGDPAELAGPVREMVRRLDPHQPVFAVRTMRDYFHQRAVVTSLRIVQVVAAMGLVGLGLALTGLYGVVSYAVSRRTREIGIRMAIGASHAGVMGMMLRQGLLLTGLGLALGLAVALPMSGFISSALFGLGVANPPTLALMLVLLVAATGLASFIPARRAALVNPVSTLRHE
jgi:predicted permease